MWNRSQNGCHKIFGGIHVRKTCTFDGRLQARKKEEVRWSQIRRVRRMIKQSYNFLSQELAHTDRTVCRDIIVEQHPFYSPVKLCPNPLDTLYQSVNKKCGINGLTCRNKFLKDDAFAIEDDQQCFDLGVLQTSLFWSRGSLNTTPSIALLIPDRTGSTKSHLP